MHLHTAQPALGTESAAFDPGFRAALLRESIDTMLAGDLETGKAVLHDDIKVTIGFTALAEAVGTPSKV